MSDGALTEATEAALAALDELHVREHDEVDRRLLLARAPIWGRDEIVERAIEVAAPILQAAALTDAANKFPVITRDMVSRGQVRDWLHAYADKFKRGAL